MKDVEWRPIRGTNGYYNISNTGIVWSNYRNIPLKPTVDRYGYQRVTLSINGRHFYRTIHRLVAEAFIANPLRLSTVNHINEIKTDNRVENLEWTNVATNVNHGTRNQRMADSKCKNPVEQILPDGRVIRFKGVKDASRKTGVNRSCISQCCKKTRHTAGGYEWRYSYDNN